MTSQFQPLTDTELARLTQAGSLGAFEELVYRYEKRIYGFIRHSCPNATEAGELTQDTFVRAFQAIGQFDPRHAFTSWLFTIARHKCCDFYRRARPETIELTPELIAGDNPGDLAARSEERANLWELARQTLPTIQFQALWLKYIEELNLAQLSQALNKSQTHVKVLLFRARRALAREINRRQRSSPLAVSERRSPPNRPFASPRLGNEQLPAL